MAMRKVSGRAMEEKEGREDGPAFLFENVICRLDLS
jgi:hypothetical protein